MDGWIDGGGWMNGWMDGCVPQAMPQSSTSLTKNGTDGCPGLAGIQGTKWHATTGPDGLWLQSYLFFLLPLNRWWINSEKYRVVKKGGREGRQSVYDERNVKKERRRQKWLSEKQDKQTDQASFPSAHFVFSLLKKCQLPL